MVTISVIVPHCGKEEYLLDSVRSALLQSVQPIEIIVILDGKHLTHQSRKVLEQSTKVKILAIPKSGVSAARNLGIREAKGEWIAFLDSDDLWDVGKLEAQILVMEPDVSFIHGNAYRFSNLSPQVFEVFAPQTYATFMNLLNGGYTVTGSCSSVIARKQRIVEVGYFDTTMLIAEDWDLWIRLAKKGKVAHTPFAVSYIRDHEESAQKRMFKNVQFSSRSSDFFSACKIYLKHLNSSENHLDQQTKIGLYERLKWEVLNSIKDPVKICLKIPRIGRMEFLEIWTELFPSKGSYGLFLLQVLLSKGSKLFRRNLMKFF